MNFGLVNFCVLACSSKIANAEPFQSRLNSVISKVVGTINDFFKSIIHYNRSYSGCFHKSILLQREFQESLHNSISIVFPQVLVQPESSHLDEQVQIHYSLVIDDLYHQ